MDVEELAWGNPGVGCLPLPVDLYMVLAVAEEGGGRGWRGEDASKPQRHTSKGFSIVAWLLNLLLGFTHPLAGDVDERAVRADAFCGLVALEQSMTELRHPPPAHGTCRRQ